VTCTVPNRRTTKERRTRREEQTHPFSFFVFFVSSWFVSTRNKAMTGLTTLDLAVIIAYLAGITAFGLYVARRVKDTEGFFMGNRRFGKVLMVAQALTTGTRADYAIGVAGASYEIGMAGIWYQWMYIFSTPFFWLLSPI